VVLWALCSCLSIANLEIPPKIVPHKKSNQLGLKENGTSIKDNNNVNQESRKKK
jgi:hypothetical protein